MKNWGSRFGGNPNRGRGYGGGFPDSTNLQSRPPMPTPRHGQTGQPSQAASGMASRLMQQIYTDDDIEYWMGDPENHDDDPETGDEENVGATFDPPYQFPSYYTDYMRVSHQWDSGHGPIGESMNLKEIFGRGNNKEVKYQKYIKMKDKIYEKAQKALQLSLTHKKFKEKLRQQNNQLDQHRIDMIEKNEDKTLNLLYPLIKEVEEIVQFLNVYQEDLKDKFDYSFICHFYDNLLNKLNEALSWTRFATAIQEYIDEVFEEASAVGGGAVGAPGQPSGQIAGYAGPLGTDNVSPYLKKKKLKKKVS